jgi:hypothetical protein
MMCMIRRGSILLVSVVFCISMASSMHAAERDDDLIPVTFHNAPEHEKVVLVEEGKPRGAIVAPEQLGGPASRALVDLRSLIKRSTGAECRLLMRSPIKA